jgi:hypothetical protein
MNVSALVRAITVASTLASSALAEEASTQVKTSEPVGTVSDLLAKGFIIVNGLPLSESKKEREATNTNPPIMYSESTYRYGQVYLKSTDKIAICQYRLVVASINGPYSKNPGSYCYLLP